MQYSPIFWLPVAGILCAFSFDANAAPPKEAEVQGYYEGSQRGGDKGFNLAARVVAKGKGNYKVLLRQTSTNAPNPGSGFGSDPLPVRLELSGRTTEDEITFSGEPGAAHWSGTYKAGTIQGACGPGCQFELKRVEQKSPSLGKKPYPGAIVLLDGKNFSEVTQANGKEWPADVADNGSIQVPGGGMNSKRAFEGSFYLHVEFMTPFMPEAHGQARGNSGIYMPNGDEIQVLDSFGEPTYLGGGCGGLYNYKDPDSMEAIESLKGKAENKFTLASYPPLTWQTYDIEYRVEKINGEYFGKPRVTVLHNNYKIHDQAELRKDAKKGNLHFQDHGNPVRYQNIWLVPLKTP